MTHLVALAALFVSSYAQAAAASAVVPGSGGPVGPGLDVGFDIDRCSSLPRDEVVRLVALELDARVVDPAHAGLETTRVQVACAGSSVELTVSDPLTGKQLMRMMTVTARDANVAGRLVALAASELVITSWMELTLPGTAAPSGAAPSPSPELRRAAQERVRRRSPPGPGGGYLLILGQAVGPFAGVGLGWGGGLRLGWTSSRQWLERAGLTGHPAADLELGGVRADATSALGEVRVSMWSAALRASFRLRRGRAWLDLGGGGRLGLARLEGVPADPTNTRGGTLAGTWAGPIAYAGVGIRFWRLIVATGIEAGHVARTVAGLVDGGTSVSVSGNWLSGSLAMGWGE